MTQAKYIANKLSIIVPCYKVEEYIKECLDSLLHQTYQDIEVIMVDDGSPDHTGDILDEYAQKYANFKAIHTENGGLSAARNAGLPYVTGEYLAFVDSDDVVPLDAYEKMVGSLQQTHSDLATGFVNRFNSEKTYPSILHKKAITGTFYKTNIKEHPELVYDTTAWNKVYKSQIFIDNDLKYPVGLTYEDIPVSLRYHLLSQNVDIIADDIYHWRVREGTNQSITQKRTNLKMFRDRLETLKLAQKALEECHASTNVKMAFYRKVISMDLPIYLNGFQNADEKTLFSFQELIFEYLKSFDLTLLNTLNVKQQIQYHALLNGDFAAFKKYGFQYNNIGRVTLKNDKYVYENNSINQAIVKKVNVTNAFCQTKILNILMHEQEVIIRGELNIKQFAKLVKPHFNFKVNVINVSNGKTCAIKGDFKKKNHRRHILWKVPYYYFNLSLNYAELLQNLGNGTWKIEIVGSDHNLKLLTNLGNPVEESNLRLPTKAIMMRQIKHFAYLSFNNAETLEIKVSDNEVNDEQLSHMPWISDFTLNSNELKFNALVPANLKDIGFSLVNKGQKYVGRVQVLKNVSNEIQYEVQFNVNDLKMLDGKYNLIMQNAENKGRYHFAYPLRTSSEVIKGLGKVLTINRKKDDNLTISLFNHYARVKELTLKPKELNIQGQVPSFITAADKISLTMLSKDKSETYADLPIARDNKGNFTIDLALYENNQPIYKAETYKLFIDIQKNGQEIRMPILGTKTATNVKYKKSQFKLSTDSNDQLQLDIIQRWSWIDNTERKRLLGYYLCYPLMRLLPIKKNIIIFESFWGRAFDDNPKAIYEYWYQHYPEYQFIWPVTDMSIKIDGPAKKIMRLSLEYWYYLAVAKYFVQNTNMPNNYAKRAGQIEVETLHGTFMKKMGFDEPKMRHSSAKGQRDFSRRNQRWDYLISPSKYMDEKVRDAFVYRNKILKTGFPRTDILIQKNNSTFINNKKQELNIPLDKKVLLYAPTYRQVGKVDFELNLKQMREKLGNQYVVLVRLHHLMANAIDIHQFEGFAYDMSSYPDIADLYLISDVLMTDYSSVMFDYGYLKRPMIFFAYDLAWYLNDTNRGVYLDYVKTVPGPIVANTQEIIDQLSDLDALKNAYHDKLHQFYDDFCTYGRLGDASKKTVETLINNADMNTQGETGFMANKLARLLHVSNISLAFFNFFGQRLKNQNIIIFESNHGKNANGNPLAMYNYLVKHNPVFELLWVTDASHEQYFKEQNLKYINRNTLKGILKLARASYWVTDRQFPNNWKKPRGLKLIQTTPGTAIKRLGNDVLADYLPGQTIYQYQKSQVIAGRRDNYVLAGNIQDAWHKKEAYRLTNNQVVMSGNPATDELLKISVDKIKNIKKDLGIADNVKVILYEPTWRDNEIVNVDQYGVKNPLNLKQISQQLPANTIMLFKYHEDVELGIPDFTDYHNLKNVSNYVNNNDLLAIADVLISDYSAVIYDFALLNKPMIFYAYDLSQYQLNIHGLYPDDYEALVPGSVVKDENQLINAIINWHNGEYDYQVKLSSFNQKYNKFNDGQAAKKAWNVIFKREKYQVKAMKNYPEQISVKNGAMMWDGVYGLSETKFIGNIDLKYSSEKMFDVLNAKVIIDPINEIEFGYPYYQIKTGDNMVWVKGQN